MWQPGDLCVFPVYLHRGLHLHYQMRHRQAQSPVFVSSTYDQDIGLRRTKLLLRIPQIMDYTGDHVLPRQRRQQLRPQLQHLHAPAHDFQSRE